MLRSKSSPFEIKGIRRNTGTASVTHKTINKFKDLTYFGDGVTVYSDLGLTINHDFDDESKVPGSLALKPSHCTLQNSSVTFGNMLQETNETDTLPNSNGNNAMFNIGYKVVELAPWTVFNFNYNDGNEDEDDDRIPKFIGKINVEDVEFIGSGATDKTIVEWD